MSANRLPLRFCHITENIIAPEKKLSKFFVANFISRKTISPLTENMLHSYGMRFDTYALKLKNYELSKLFHTQTC